MTFASCVWRMLAAQAAEDSAAPRRSSPNTAAVAAVTARAHPQHEILDLTPHAEALAVGADRSSLGRLTTHDDLPSLGPDGPRVRIPSRFESFARRVQKEGLPLARLYENHAMLISVGLNPKGKFGLWLIQKVP